MNSQTNNQSGKEDRQVAHKEDDKINMRLAVLIPCYNEAVTVGTVVSEFQRALPNATIYVYDNNSSDETSLVAEAAGAVVYHEEYQGKGNVVRRMFSDIEADVYVLVDGDDTYSASSSPMLINHLVNRHLDMVNAARRAEAKTAYRPGHRFGNLLLTNLVVWIFGDRFRDMLSGYRILSRRFVKSFPALSSGFEIETELTVHALELRMPTEEILTDYKERPEGSSSKLRTFSDGMRILKTIFILIKEERPLQFFTLVSTLLVIISLFLAWPILIEYFQTGLVPRFPTAILITGIMLLAFTSFGIGLILDTVTHGRREMKRLWYLSIPQSFESLSSKRENVK